MKEQIDEDMKTMEIEAIRFDDDTDVLIKIQEFMGGIDLSIDYTDPKSPKLKIQTLEGEMKASVGDMIIKGVNGEFYPCKPDIFEKTYDLEESTFKQRLEKEKNELEEKLDKLDSFLISKKVDTVDDVQKALLQVQSTAMNTYHQCLKERLERL